MSNEMKQKIVEQLLSVLKGYRRDVVEKLAGKYAFDVLEALEYLNQDTSSEIAVSENKPAVPVKEKVVKAKVAKVTLTEEEKAEKLAEKEAEKQKKLAEKEAEKQAKLSEKEAEKQKKLAEK